MTDRQPPPEALSAREIALNILLPISHKNEIVAGVNSTELLHKITLALDAFAQQTVSEVETAAFIRGREAGVRLVELEAKYGSFDGRVQAEIAKREQQARDRALEEAAQWHEGEAAAVRYSQYDPNRLLKSGFHEWCATNIRRTLKSKAQ